MTEVAFLSDEWLSRFEQATASLPDTPGVDGSMLVVVSGAPDGKVQFSFRFESGRVVGLAAGKAAADITITWKYAEAVAVFSGERHPDVAFMQGRTKVEGDYARYLLTLRPVLDGEPWRTALRDLAASTAF